MCDDTSDTDSTPSTATSQDSGPSATVAQPPAVMLGPLTEVELEPLYERVARTWSNAQRQGEAHFLDLATSITRFGDWSRIGVPVDTEDNYFAFFRTPDDRYALIAIPEQNPAPNETAANVVKLFQKTATVDNMAGTFLSLWDWVLGRNKGEQAELLRTIWRELTKRPSQEQFIAALDLLPRTEAQVAVEHAKYSMPTWTECNRLLHDAISDFLPDVSMRERNLVNDLASDATQAWLATVPTAGIAADFLEERGQLMPALKNVYTGFVVEQMDLDAKCNRRAPMLPPPVPQSLTMPVTVTID